MSEPKRDGDPKPSPSDLRSDKPAPRKRSARAEADAPPSRRRSALTELAIGALLLIGIRAALLLLSIFLPTAPLAQVVIGALVVDVVAGRAGLEWTPPEETFWPQLRRSLFGVGGAAITLAVTIALSVGLAWAKIESGHLDAMVLLALVGGGATAVRDELLLRGVPLMFGARLNIPKPAVIGFAALLSPALALADAPLTAGSLALSIASGLFFASLYAYAGGAPTAIGAHAAWLFGLGPILRGLVETSWLKGELGDGRAAGGAPAFLASAVLVVLALLTPRVARRFGLAKEAPPAALKPTPSKQATSKTAPAPAPKTDVATPEADSDQPS